MRKKESPRSRARVDIDRDGTRGRVAEKLGRRAISVPLVVTVLAVALGGGVGTALRYLIAAPLNDRTPALGTTVVNVVGSLVLGVLLGWFSTRQGNATLRLAIGTGVLGGFTTFSAWSIELVDALDRPGRLVMLLVLPIVLGLTAAWFGIRIGRAI